ncbi:alpha/beta hydrolase [uncultured Algibacter sp.]|jgi:pimeloyl-ACP methyl ester carboxylesterase|uniref:alpha/beta fold hydrolase n=1 Tax=uncultured Algibacter sp. TaxID=298659 RepID=UPI00261635F8|nr:alpha/beta hydrolase [uncultured Algibacter sp.]
MKYILIFFCWISFKVSGQALQDIQYGNNSIVGSYANVNGITMYYEKYGEGEPIILLHGGTGSISEFQFLIPYLSKKFKVYALDFRGHGRTNNNLDAMSYSLLTKDIIQFINYLNLNTIKIIGYSDGGIVALKLAIDIPEKIEKMIVVSANKSVSDLNKQFIGFAKTMITDNNLKNAYIKREKKKYDTINPEPEKYQRFMQLMGQMWLHDPYIKNRDYAKISTPLLMVYGDNDAFHFDAMIDMYKNLNCKKKQLCILPNTNHFVFKKKHAKIINPIIHKYLVSD